MFSQNINFNNILLYDRMRPSTKLAYDPAQCGPEVATRRLEVDADEDVYRQLRPPTPPVDTSPLLASNVEWLLCHHLGEGSRENIVHFCYCV